MDHTISKIQDANVPNKSKHEAYKLIIKILTNIVENENDDKYRYVKRGKTLNERLFQHEETRQMFEDLLFDIGFTISNSSTSGSEEIRYYLPEDIPVTTIGNHRDFLLAVSESLDVSASTLPSSLSSSSSPSLAALSSSSLTPTSSSPSSSSFLSTPLSSSSPLTPLSSSSSQPSLQPSSTSNESPDFESEMLKDFNRDGDVKREFNNNDDNSSENNNEKKNSDFVDDLSHPCSRLQSLESTSSLKSSRRKQLTTKQEMDKQEQELKEARELQRQRFEATSSSSSYSWFSNNDSSGNVCGRPSQSQPSSSQTSSFSNWFRWGNDNDDTTSGRRTTTNRRQIKTIKDLPPLKPKRG